MNPMRLSQAVAVYCLLIAVQVSLAQDIVKLKNGNTLKGRAFEEPGDTIRVEIDPGIVMTFPKKDVAEIIRGKAAPARLSPEQTRPDSMPETREGAPEDEATQLERKRQSRLEAAERYKANNEVLKLTRQAREAATEKQFQQALNCLDQARQLAVKHLPSSKLKEIEKEIESVLEYGRIVLEIRMGEIYISPSYVEQVVQEKKREAKEKGEGWDRDGRKELLEEISNAIRTEMAQQLAAHLAAGLQRCGYIPVHPDQLQGQRTSVLQVTYEEAGLVGALGPWRPPMPGPIGGYGMGLQIDCALKIIGPYGEDVWSEKVNIVTPISASWDLAVRQAALSIFFQRLDSLTFKSDE